MIVYQHRFQGVSPSLTPGFMPLGYTLIQIHICAWQKRKFRFNFKCDFRLDDNDDGSHEKEECIKES
jgi:hypothetical protein